MAAARSMLRQTVSCLALRRLAVPVARVPFRHSQLAALTLPSTRSFSSKVTKVLQSELKHEEENYEQDKVVAAFLKNSPFKFVQKDGDVNMKLERAEGNKTVSIEFQLSSPVDFEAEEAGQEPFISTEFSVSVDDKSGAGLAFYCSTETGEGHRYVIGNVRAYSSAEEKEGLTGYNGPEFEDLDEALQEAFDEYLGELGVSPEVCDFLDAMSTDKEQREYIRWLKLSQSCFEN
eukprot:TRINITY_DN94962_c0_g1_i1.p1 TRINITY_DN94962_c0_g1~~TRINITY_DN94962_c0_g1_i1.p1  ORF type:complete len:233 (-),score=58.88 TRINITY_DN94962_c0_g1_i1:160-858(-)